MNPTTTLTIPRRFRGPDHSANGGLIAGTLAQRLRPGLGATVEVTLKAPPPLDTPLLVSQQAEQGQLEHAGVLLAQARITEALELALPPDCGYPQAVAASARYVGHHHHPYPGCFVCGTARAAGDGLRIFAGALGQADIVAAGWTPDPSLADAQDQLPLQLLWAALDCPSYFALGRPGLPALLGRMTAQLLDRPAIGEQCVVMAAPTGSEGRKHSAVSVIYGADGRQLALARTLWIELRSA